MGAGGWGGGVDDVARLHPGDGVRAGQPHGAAGDRRERGGRDEVVLWRVGGVCLLRAPTQAQGGVKPV